MAVVPTEDAWERTKAGRDRTGVERSDDSILGVQRYRRLTNKYPVGMESGRLARWAGRAELLMKTSGIISI